MTGVEEVVDVLRAAGARPGSVVGLAVADAGAGLAVPPAERRATAGGDGTGVVAIGPAEARAAIARVEHELAPRWVWWSSSTAATLVDGGVRVARCWDVAAVHRLLRGGWRASPERVWAEAHGLDPTGVADTGPVDLFTHATHDALEAGDPEDPVRADGHLRAAWIAGGWAASPARLARWAAAAVEVAGRQEARLTAAADGGRSLRTARSESAAELLCAELGHDGLPVDRAAAEAVIAGIVGPRPATPADAAAERARRDREVLRHAPPDVAGLDLRSPGQVRSLLRRVGIEVPDTRAWRLEGRRDAHPVVEPLLAWRKAERVETTYGYRWLDEHVGADGRLRGTWTGSDGAAGRMTASAGLHNLPTELRAAVIAEPGHVFVRADLGQIEPRVLAVVADDPALARAAERDDLYALVADELGVDRPTAKVAMLGAMYGQTSGRGAEVQHRLRAAYPRAMAYLEEADRAGQAGRALRTYGGRLIRFGPTGGSDADARGRAAAMGRYGRNAVVQGAAAELFKVWAATVRARTAALDGRIVLCLHDELLVHGPADHGDALAAVVAESLREAAHRWSPASGVRFVVDLRVLRCWGDAKD